MRSLLPVSWFALGLLAYACAQSLLVSADPFSTPLFVAGVGLAIMGLVRQRQSGLADSEEREHAAEKLVHSERMLAEALEVGRIGSWEVNVETNTIWWSDEQARMLGLPPGSPAPTWDEAVSQIPERCRAQFDRDMALLYENGLHQWTVAIADASGSERALHCRGRVVRDGTGRPLRLIGTSVDVTEASRSAELLRASEERFRLLASATKDAVWDFDAATGRVWRGESFKTMFGDSADSCSDAESWAARIHPEDRDAVVASCEDAIRDGLMSWSSEYRFRRADGTWATILDRAYIARDESMRAVRMLGAMMDLSERKQLEAQLEQANRVSGLGRVAASIAHEFNNVLMGIQPNIEVLRRLDSAPPPHVIDNIVRSVQRGRAVTDEILRFTRRSEPDLRTIEVKTFLEHWREDVQPLLGSMTLAVNLAEDELYMSADALKLAQVLTNLSINARDAMSGTGQAVLSVRPATSKSRFQFGGSSKDRLLQFTLTDEGCGIDETVLPHIFEPLFTTKSGGTGLGLAICHQIVTQHGGRIVVESERGRGTSFHIFIPAAQAAAEEAPARHVAVAGGQRVLLVEDESSVAAGLQMLFELDDWSVHVVSRGSEAVRAIAEFGPDVVVLDISLPDVNGVDVFRMIETQWPDLPVLFSSGHADSTELGGLLARPHIGFIAKPYEYKEIQAALASVMAHGVDRMRLATA